MVYTTRTCQVCPSYDFLESMTCIAENWMEFVTNLARRIYNEARETGSSDFAETQLDLWKRELQDDDWFSWIAVPPEVLKMILCRANLDSAYSQEGGTMRVGISMS